MKHSFLILALFCFLALFPCRALRAEITLPRQQLEPDTILMNNGAILHGLIIRNDAQHVILQTKDREMTIPKTEIQRIDDEGDTRVYFADMLNPDTLPPWRMIVLELRTDDSIKTFQEIPATAISNGYLKNIPYLSFRLNTRIEMNVYGNPEHPVALEFGLYEVKPSKITEFKKIIRAYLAGFLSSKEQVGALYSLPDSGGKKQVGKFCFQITPPSSPDAYGGWWMAVYDTDRLDKARVSDAEYAKLTLPFDEVNAPHGMLNPDKKGMFDTFLSNTRRAWETVVPDIGGFYRDESGDFKSLSTKNSGNGS